MDLLTENKNSAGNILLEDAFEKEMEAKLDSTINTIKEKSSSMRQGRPQEVGTLEESQHSTRMPSI